MYRPPILLGLALCGILAAVHAGVVGARGTIDYWDRKDLRQRERARFMAVAEAIGLYCGTDSADLATGRKLVLSDVPVSHWQHSTLTVNNQHFHRWQGIVAVYLGMPDMWESNHDPAYPERTVIVGDSFVYGDPELIERVRAAFR
jgi:hypothetical protein